MGTYAYSFGSPGPYSPYTFAVDAFTPDCQWCGGTASSDDWTGILVDGTWSSSWNADHSAIDLFLGTTLHDVVSRDGSSITQSEAPNLTENRQGASDPMMRTCGGHVVVSSTDW